MGQIVHQESFDSTYIPVEALARQVHRIMKYGGHAEPLICIFYNNNALTPVNATNMIDIIRKYIIRLKLHKKGIYLDLFGVHSVRIGGAIALKLHSESNTTIMKVVQWSELTFLQYIHNQISHLSKGLFKKTSTSIPFLNIASITE